MTEHDCFDDHPMDECCDDCAENCEDEFYEEYANHQYDEVDFGEDE